MSTETATSTQEEAVSTNTETDSLVSFLLDEKPPKEQNQQQSQTEEVPLYKKWGWDSVEVAEKEISELKEYKQKVKPIEEVPFENEESKKAYQYLKEGKEDDLYNFLNQKKQVEKLASAEINESTAADLVKFAMQNKYKDLTKEQIEYKFNKQFGIPKEPVMLDTELDEEYEVRKSEWAEKVKEIKMDLEIEARLAKPEIEKLKTELKLPDIKTSEGETSKLSQEDLKAIKESQEFVLKDVQKFTSEFNGFTVPVKDKDVDYSVAYSLDEKEKSLVTEKVRYMVEDNFNANAIFAERWLSEDGKSINTQQMVKDLSILYNFDNITSRIALDASNKRLEKYLEQKKNININETSVNGQFNPENKPEGDLLRDAILKV